MLVASTGRVAQLSEFAADLPAAGQEVSTGGDNSPSGRDWAWVRGELRAEGDPEALVAALAALRG